MMKKYAQLIFVLIGTVLVVNTSFSVMKNYMGPTCCIFPVMQEAADEMAERNQGITFRGAMLDGQWYNSESLYRKGNWSWDVNTRKICSVDEGYCVLKLPVADESYLVFDADPEQGLCNVVIDDTVIALNLYRDSANTSEYGESVLLPKTGITISMCKAFSIMIGICFLMVYILGKKYLLEYKNSRAAKSLFLLSLLPISAVFLLYTSVSSTPLAKDYYGMDAQVFVTIGKAWYEGIVPYRDIFDHKGPLIFFIYMIAWVIDYDWGIYVLQVIALWASLVFGYYIGKEILGPDTNKGMWVPLISLLFFEIVIDEGALTEEFNLPFLMWSTFLIIKYLHHTGEDVAHPPLYAAVYGMTLAISLGFRVTNCVYICVFVAAIVIYLMYKKQLMNILHNAACFLLGFCVIILPFVVYFAAKGALYDLAWGTVLYNMQYASENAVHSKEEYFQIAVYLLPVVFCMIVSLEQKSIMRNAVLAGGFVTIWWLVRCYFFPHYYIITLPFVAIAAAFVLQKSGYSVNIFCRYRMVYAVAVGAGILTLLYYSVNNMQAKSNWIHALEDQSNVNYESEYEIAARKQAELIPYEDRNAVIAYNIDSSWYLITDIMPCFKYYVMQDWQMSHSQQMTQENIDFYNTMEAKWIVTGKGEIAQPEIRQIITDHYYIYHQVYIDSEDYFLTLYCRR